MSANKSTSAATAEEKLAREANAIEPYIVKDPELFAKNLARMIEAAGHAASEWMKPRESGEKTDTVADPAAEMIKTLSKVTEYWLSDPQRALEAQTKLFSSYYGIWANSIQRMGDDTVPEAKPSDPRDKRFLDDDWRDNSFFSFVKQAYLVTADWAIDLVESTENLDPHTRHKAEFYMRQFTNAVAPSNFLISNPEIFKDTIASNGENLVRGLTMLADDIKAGGGDLKLRQADDTKFAVGENMALTPGKVIARNELVEIIQYEPTTEKVLKTPLLIVPPWINKFYILDLNADKSFIKWAVDQGHSVFVVSWANPDERHANMDWTAYAKQGLFFALDTVEQATGEKQINAIGYCVGGTLLCASMALMARMGENRIASATLFTTQVDFENAGDLKVFVDDEQLEMLEKQMAQKGYLDGSKMATAFNMLRSGDLIWPYMVNNYMKGKDPMPFDLLYWNSDATRMAAANHLFYLRNCYHENNLSKDKMELDGAPISLADVKVPIYNLAAKEDHIAPALSVFEGSKYFGGDVTYVMGGSGHIAGVINPPHKNKYQYWTGGKVSGDFGDWVANARENPGSWWPHWHEWIRQQNGETVNARTQLGGGKLTAMEDAPGLNVKVRV